MVDGLEGTSAVSETTLALDMGSASIGWALFRGDPADFENNKRLLKSGECPIIDAGVRIFESGVESIETEKEESRNSARRLARQVRRQTMRRARRQRKVYHVLHRAGMLPDIAPGDARDARRFRSAIQKFDRITAGKWAKTATSSQEKRHIHQHLPYHLREEALHQALTPLELGRVFYALAQRRGFKSNRKESKAPDQSTEAKELGAVKGEIQDIHAAMDAAKAPTIGAYLNRLARRDPKAIAAEREYRADKILNLSGEHEDSDDALSTHLRLRKRWTGREMFEHEFEAIWTKQEEFHPQLLTEKLKKKLRTAIFLQRPLKSVAHLIGFCDLENGRTKLKDAAGNNPTTSKRRRAPWYSLQAQRYRMLQKVNDLRICDGAFVPLDRRGDADLGPDDDLEKIAVGHLTNAERQLLLNELTNASKLSFADIATLLGRKHGARAKKNGIRFNLEQGGEKQLRGNSTNAAMRAIFTPEEWDAFDDTKKHQIVRIWSTFRQDEPLVRYAQKQYGLSAEAAARYAQAPLEDGYCGLSAKAIERLLPHMEQGLPFTTAKMKCYELLENQEKRDLLPPVDQVFDSLSNPVVKRALTELRRTVNSIIHRFGGVPGRIRVELARDLKKSKDDRLKTSKRMREGEARRESARERLQKDHGWQNPPRYAIERVLLHDAQKGLCPYTGKRIEFADIFSKAEVDHIIPFSRCLDNSFGNKVLCTTEANRDKSNSTPWEAFHHDEERWSAILKRAKDLGHAQKLKRISLNDAELTTWLSEFNNRSLVDTAHASRLALDYLGTLYGLAAGASHTHSSDGVQAIQVSNGQITSVLRRKLGQADEQGKWRSLNHLLAGDPAKTRQDHRHHVIDAVVVALASPSMRKRLEHLAGKAEAGKARFFSSDTPLSQQPWESFYGDIAAVLDRVVPSIARNKRVTGAIHEETFYSPPRDLKSGKLVGEDHPSAATVYYIRRRVADLKPSDFEKIVNEDIQEAVEKHHEALGRPSKLTAFEQAPPLTKPDVNGERRPIYRVRLKYSANAMLQLGDDAGRERFAKSASNHHMEVIETVDSKGQRKWQGVPVSMSEVYSRKRALPKALPVVERNHGDGKRFVCALFKGSLLEIDNPFKDRVEAAKASGTASSLLRELEKDRVIVRVRGTRVSGALQFILALDARQKAESISSKMFGENPINTFAKWNPKLVHARPDNTIQMIDLLESGA